MSSLRVVMATPLLAGLLVGCATQSPEEALADDDADAKRPLFGVVAVERDLGEGRDRASISAKFLRVSPGDRAFADQLVGGRPSLPAPGECTALATLEARAERIPAAASEPRTSSFELVDVGDVTVVVREPGEPSLDARVALAPRAFPDVGDLLSGVFYTSPDDEVVLPAPGSYLLGSTGAQAIDAFTIDASAPPAPGNLQIAGRNVDGEELVDGELPSLEITAGADLPLAWDGLQDPSTNAASLDASVYVDVRGTSTWRCAFEDRGSAIVPGSLLLGSSEGGGLELTIHRLVERSAVMSATDAALSDEVSEAVVRFDLARTVRLVAR